MNKIHSLYFYLGKCKSKFFVQLRFHAFYLISFAVINDPSMMRIAIFGKAYKPEQSQYLKLLFEELNKRNATLCFYKPYYEAIKHELSGENNLCFYKSYSTLKNNADMMISIGGDGTILDTLPFIRDSKIPILGINLGRLGFLSSISKDEIVDAIDNVWKGNYFIEERALLELSKPADIFGDVNFALNDITIYRNNTTSLITVHVYLNDQFLNTYWGDGLIVSTPTGSTAYSLSVGGPIVAPGTENFVIAPIASHNLTVRPIVIQDNNIIRIRLEGRENNYVLSLDSQQRTMNINDELIIKRCDFKVNLVQMTDKDFYTTIREKLLWGKDIRN
jgi:NAD+ kinase